MTIDQTVQQNHLSVRSRIYRILSDTEGTFSKKELAEMCGISMPTLHQNLKELIDAGLISYTDEWQHTGGRRARGLDIVPDARFSVGIFFNKNTFRIVAADLRLREMAYDSMPFDFDSCLEGTAPKVSNLLEQFLVNTSLDSSRLLGVCVAVPGLISKDQTTIEFAPTLGIRDFPLSRLLGDIPYPVHIVNDATASGRAEHFMRKQNGNMAYLSLENGVGGAVVINDSPYDGDHSRSGEFGHICVEPGGLPCSCGKLGCLEPYCSPNRIKTSLGISIDDFFKNVEEHDPVSISLFFDMLRHLAIGINSIRMTLDCDVVLGGFLSEYLVPYLDILRNYVLAGNPFEENADFVQFSTLRKHITPLGAALYYIRRFVENV
ncbi:MAG: ROK family transcriptional regulator [Lachnospiraceae bacterium]|nr:ROK family transcriptional regulator [Lachnospiraceae bacterium]MBQ6495609.1 ROK family transcriptional regulator [Bacillota bacterium]